MRSDLRFGWRKVPVTILLVFAIMMTAGATKLTFGVNTTLLFLANEMALQDAMWLPLVNLFLGASVIWAVLATYLRRPYGKRLLQVLTLLLLVLDVGVTVGSQVLQAGGSIAYSLVTWLAYIGVLWMLSTKSATDYRASPEAK